MNWLQKFWQIFEERRKLIAEIDRLKEKALDWQAPEIESPIYQDWLHLYALVSNQTGVTAEMLDHEYLVPQMALWSHFEEWAYENIGPKYDEPDRNIKCDELAAFTYVAAQLVESRLPIGFAVVKTQNARHMLNIVVYHHNGELEVGFLDATPRHVFEDPPPRGIIPVDFFPLIESIRI